MCPCKLDNLHSGFQPYILSGVGRCFIAGGLTIVGVSINFNAGGSGGILPQEISKF